jgi:hypothetical protein
MEGVNLASHEMLNAVVSMCPHLKTVEFTLLPVNPGDTIIASDEHLQTLLSNKFTEVFLSTLSVLSLSDIHKKSIRLGG